VLRIACPWCGVRDEDEFVFGGEAHLARPEPSSAATDAQWAEYLFFRDNPKGLHRERWQHRGCRQWFNVVRHTVSHAIVAIYRLDEAPPALGDAPP
jgi:heterotetrameric sarcosine oxidase delta subunit